MIKLSDFYKKVFSFKVYKIALDAFCSCPNRDGTKGVGGCIFCSEKGSGDFIYSSKSVEEQYLQGISLIKNKTKVKKDFSCKYIAYFQKYTSTYGDEKRLRQIFTEATQFPDCVGISIATRPDCLSDNMIEFFAELSTKTFLQIELGLQTSNEKTGLFINRCYSNDDYKNSLQKLKTLVPKCHIVTHLIFGLPFESKDEMLESVDFVVNENTKYINEEKKFSSYYGIKFTNLYVVKNTYLETLYKNNEFSCLSKNEYFEILEKALLKLDKNCVVHRFSGDPPKKDFIAPEWSLNKKQILSDVNNLLLKIDSCAGH